MNNESSAIMTLYTITPTHPGSGTELSYVDLPIQREGHTGYPKIEASTLKGCVRYAASRKHHSENGGKDIETLFGHPDGDFASAVSFTDGRLLFFPVKSAIGVFAWITCPYVLNRFLSDFQLAFGQEALGTLNLPDFLKRPKSLKDGEALSATECELHMISDGKPKVMLEDYTYEVQQSKEFDDFVKELEACLPKNEALTSRFQAHTLVLSDDDFSHFVKYSTEINTRIKIDPQTGTAANTALFTEEFLPPECVLYSSLFFQEERKAQNNQGDRSKSLSDGKKTKDYFFRLVKAGDILQIGSDYTLGKGFVKIGYWRETTDGK